MPYDYETLVSAIKQSPSPNLAYRTAKELLEDQPDVRSRLSRECLDYAWNDAKRFNQMVERLEGRLSRPQRLTSDQQLTESEANKIRNSRKPHAELGRVMAVYDIDSVRTIYRLVSDMFEQKETP